MKYRPLRKKPSLSGKRFGATNVNLYFDTRALRLIYSFVDKILGDGGYLPKFSYPKKSRDRKFQTQTNPSITPVTLNREYLHWVMCRRKWSQFPFNPQTYKGGRGEHPLRFFCFFSKTIKRQHLKFSVAVRLSLQYHGGGMTLRVRPRVKTNREP